MTHAGTLDQQARDMIVLLQCLPRVIERHFIADHVHCCRNCCRSQCCWMCDHHQQSGVAAMLSHMSDELVQLVRSQDLSQLQMQDPGCLSHPSSESLWYRNLITHDPRGCAHDAAYTPPSLLHGQMPDMQIHIGRSHPTKRWNSSTALDMART